MRQKIHMLIEMLGKSLRREFVIEEQRTFIADPFEYINGLMTTFKGDAPNRLLGNAFMVLNEHCGDGAGLGFMTTLQLLHKHAKSQQNGLWLEAQYTSIQTLGTDRVGDYVISFISNPSPEIQRLSRTLAKSSIINGFIIYGENRWSGFATGALLLIGILLESEKFSSTTLIEKT